MKDIKQLLCLALLATSMVSCSIMGINMKYKTPKKPSKYPVFTEADTLRGKITKYRKVFDINYYNINIDVDTENKYIKGFVDIYFTALDDIDTIQIDLYENLKINKITYKSDSLQFQRKYKAVFIPFDTKIAKGVRSKITVFYEGQPAVAKRPPWEGGFVWKKDKDKNPWIGVACELYGASLWWPLKDVLYDEPDSLTMHVTIPEGLFCVSNGRLIEHKKIDKKETFTWKTNYPINTYNTTIYIGNFKHFTLPYQKDDKTYNLDFYVLPYDLEKAKTQFQQAVDIIKFYEYKFGEYPWWNEGYKLVEAPYAGMENQTAIAYGNKYKNQWLGYNFDYIILHETAHEWWGNSVTASDYAEIWLHEGFATYSEALYIEHLKGYNEYLKYLRIYSLFIKNKQPVIGPYDVNYWNYKDGDVYMKGALMLHTLRNLINNDTVFFDIIKTFYNRNKYSIAKTVDFINLVKEKTGVSYSWFFEQYLYSRVCPQLEYNPFYNNDKNCYELRYKWNNANIDFKMPVVVKAGEKTIIIHPTNAVQSIELNPQEHIYINTNYSYISLKENKKL